MLTYRSHPLPNPTTQRGLRLLVRKGRYCHFTNPCFPPSLFRRLIKCKRPLCVRYGSRPRTGSRTGHRPDRRAAGSPPRCAFPASRCPLRSHRAVLPRQPACGAAAPRRHFEPQGSGTRTGGSPTAAGQGGGRRGAAPLPPAQGEAGPAACSPGERPSAPVPPTSGPGCSRHRPGAPPRGAAAPWRPGWGAFPVGRGAAGAAPGSHQGAVAARR